MRMAKRLALVAVLVLCGLLGAAYAQEDTYVSDVRYTVDFDFAAQLSQDCAAWLYQPDCGLNAPVMHSPTKDWYYDRGFDGSKIYRVGSLFTQPDESMQDDVLIIRGQVRSEEGCFRTLTEWRDAEMAAQREPFVLLTPEGDYVAEAFACVEMEQRDMNKWDPSQTEEGIDAWLDRVTQDAMWSVEAFYPQEGDRLLLLAGLHLNGKCTMVMTALKPVAYAGEEEIDLSKMQLDTAETVSGYVDAGPAGEMMYYAQNGPLFGEMRYESAMRSGDYRDFGEGGCGPTAMAIIVANLVETEDLPLIGQNAKTELGNVFCPCSVNRLYCDHTHMPYRMGSPEEYLRYLPAAMGDFAAGNNKWDMVARRPKSNGTNIAFADYAAEVYGLTKTPLSTLDEAFALVRENPGEGLVLMSALAGSPMTNTSHFIVLTGVDDEYFYMLDPMYRTPERYKITDKRRLIEVLQPGVVRMALKDTYRSDIVPVAYFTKGE